MNYNSCNIVNMITIENKKSLTEPIKEENNGIYNCIICYDEYNKENILFPCKLSKNHIICNSCFEKWKNNCFKESKEVTCPICRNVLTKNGTYILYYQDGIKKQEVQYINDIPHGLVQMWNYQGILKLKFYTQNNKYHGLYEEYDDEGFLKKRCYYNDHILNNIFEEYYPYGILKIQCTYSNGLINGIYKLFYNNSLLFIECECGPIGGKINGYLHIYNDEGILIEKYNCKNAQIDIKFDEELNVSYNRKSGSFQLIKE